MLYRALLNPVTGTYPDVPESKHRDENKERAAKIIPIAEEAEKKQVSWYFIFIV